MDRGACWATVHGVAKSRTQLKQVKDIISRYVDPLLKSVSPFMIPERKLSIGFLGSGGNLCKFHVHIISEHSHLQNLQAPLLLLKQFGSVAQSCPTLCDPMDCSTLGFPVHQQLPELAQTHVH